MTDYLKAGVDIAAGNELVEEIKPIVQSTVRSGVMGSIGAFGALFNLSAIGKSYKSPILVSSTDGVGTKLCVAQEMQIHDSIGEDLVAMCVNDVLVQGAEPLFFLDYFATGKLEKEVAVSVIRGIAKGCQEAQAALIGGETAEMPGMYDGGKYDVAGFAVGIVEQDNLLPRTNKMKIGDVIIGFASSGIHSNGFSLVRRILEDVGISYKEKSPWGGKSWGEFILEPTRIYVRTLLPILHFIKGMAHITGGGLLENIPRVLPPHLYAALNSWEWPEIFQWLQQEGGVGTDEMLRTFNCGIGMIAIVAQEDVGVLSSILTQKKERFYLLGTLQSNVGKNARAVEFI